MFTLSNQIRITQENQSTTIKHLVGLIVKGLPGGEVVVDLGRPKRSNGQNEKMWPMLTDISKQVEWYGQKYTKEEWKEIISAGLTKQKMAPGIEGGIVMLGVSTRKKSRAWFRDIIELLYAFGTEHNVQWSEKAIDIYNEHRGSS